MKIALLALCKNEINLIVDYLERAKDVDYICIFDTGSTDGTWEYLQEQAQLNPKLILQQKTYDFFRFDVARNESLSLLPDDVELIVQLDIDERFREKNWVEILKQLPNPNRPFRYDTVYLDASTLAPLKAARMLAGARIFTKGLNWVFPVHECLTDPRLDLLGISYGDYTFLDNLLIIHTPDKSKPRSSYIELLNLRLKEELPLHYDKKFEEINIKMMLFEEYFRNEMYEKAQQEYELLKNDEFGRFLMNPYMYLITKNTDYLLEPIINLPKYGYDAMVLFYALLEVPEYCSEHLNMISKIVEDFENVVPEEFHKYDDNLRKIKKMIEDLKIEQETNYIND